MANPATLRTAIKTALAASLSGVTVYDHMPEKVQAPCCIINVPDGTYTLDMGDSANIKAMVVALGGALGNGFARGQSKLDAMLADSGAGSVKAALDADKALGGAAYTLKVNGWSDYGALAVAGVEYVGALISVDIWAA